MNRKTTSAAADFSVRYTWQAGSMPPPYYYEYSIQLGPGPEGTIQFQPDYAFNAPPIWTQQLAVTEQRLAELVTLLAEKGVFDRDFKQTERPPTGGSIEWVEGTAHGNLFSVPAQLDTQDTSLMRDVYQAIRAFVPEPVWATLMAQRKAYEQAYLDKER